MRTSIVQIGNSKGIRIPKPFLEQCGLDKTVDLEVRSRRLVISAAVHPRQNWEESFQKMAAREDDRLLETPASSWDRSQWEWK